MVLKRVFTVPEENSHRNNPYDLIHGTNIVDTGMHESTCMYEMYKHVANPHVTRIYKHPFPTKPIQPYSSYYILLLLNCNTFCTNLHTHHEYWRRLQHFTHAGTSIFKPVSVPRRQYFLFPLFSFGLQNYGVVVFWNLMWQVLRKQKSKQQNKSITYDTVTVVSIIPQSGFWPILVQRLSIIE